MSASDYHCDEKWSPGEWVLSAKNDEGDRFDIASFDARQLIQAHAAMTSAVVASREALTGRKAELDPRIIQNLAAHLPVKPILDLALQVVERRRVILVKLREVLERNSGSEEDQRSIVSLARQLTGLEE